jgi:hypothetical protein
MAASKRRDTLIASRKRLFDRGSESTRHSNFAMIAPHRNASITSAALSTIDARKNDGINRRQDRKWQTRAYELLTEVGELGFLMQLKASLVARCDFIPEYLDDEGNWDSLPEDMLGPRRVMDAFVGPQGGQTELKRQAALHLSVAGEAHLVGTPLEGGKNGLLWEFLSVDEITITAEGNVMRRRSRAGALEELDRDKTYIARLWRPAAQYSDEPDAEVRRVIRVAEEVLTLTQMVDAVSRSRLSAGLLYVPDEITFDDDETDEVAEDGDEMDPFTATLIEHMSAPVTDRESAASLVPLVLRGPAAMADSIKLIDLARDIDTWAQALRHEALQRLAQGVDAPPEIMTGLGSTNHWGSFQVDADFVSKHIAPLGEMLAEFLTFAYLRPMLAEFEAVLDEQSHRFRLTFDLGPIAARADEAAAAARLHNDELISDEALIRSSGFDATADRPSEEEKLERRQWALIERAPSVFAKILLNEIPGFENIDLSALDNQGGGLGGGGSTMDGDDPANSGDPAILRTTDAQTGQELPRTAVPGFSSDIGTLTRTIVVAADSALERALEKAGARLVAKSTKVPDIRERLRSAPKIHALELVSADDLAPVVKLEELFADAWDMFGAKVATWVTAHLTDAGVDTLAASDQGALVSSVLCASLDEFTLSKVHQGFPPGPNRLRVPDALVLRALGVVLSATAPAPAGV